MDDLDHKASSREFRVATGWLLTVCSLAFFFVCLFFPALNCVGRVGPMGWDVLIGGWMAILTLDPRWFANVLLLRIWNWTLRNRAAPKPTRSACFAAVFAGTSLIVPAMACGSGAGGAEPSTGLALGGYLWVAAVFSGVVGCWLLPRGSRTMQTTSAASDNADLPRNVD
jgi:hypothetical protein